MRQVQDQTAARASQDGTAGEHLRTQRGRLAINGQANGTLKLTEQVEQQQDSLESGFSGEERLQAETVGSQIVLELSDAVLHVGPPVVVAPDFLGGIVAVGNEEAKGIAGYRATKDNPLNDSDRFIAALALVAGKRITYKELIGKGKEVF